MSDEMSHRSTAIAPKKIRVISAVGPGDVVGAFRDWKEGTRTVSETSITFSSQEFEFFEKHRVAFWVVSSHSRRESLSDGPNRIENRPRVTTKPVAGVAFHLVQVLYALSLLNSAIRFRATHAIIDSGTTQWFALCLFRLFNIVVVPNFHNACWSLADRSSSVSQRALSWLDGIFFKYCVRSALGVSPDGVRQVRLVSAGNTKFFEYRAQFVRSDFGELPRAKMSMPVRIMFAGRVEEEKGVFDVVRISELLSVRHPNRFVFDICGTGGAFDLLAAEIAAREISDFVILHGKLNRPDLLKVYGRSHLVIVPTRSSSSEGLPMICAEAVIAGRPVITSRVSNSLEVLRGAVIEARADDSLDYANKIELLADDPQAYAELVCNTWSVSMQFTNPDFGLTHVLEQCLLHAAPRGINRNDV